MSHEKQPDDDPPRDSALAVQNASRRKPYVAPKLVAYGSVTKLTQGGGSRPRADGHSGMTMP